MGFLKLCNNDDLLKTLRDTFKANPIRIPEERIQPLIVFDRSGINTKYIGRVENLLADSSPLVLPVEEGRVADLSGSKTKSIDAKIGIQIMDGFLKGLGSSSAGLSAAFKDVQKVSFSFKYVNRKYIDVGLLCKILSDKTFDTHNPVNRKFVSGASECTIVDSVITSNNFSIIVDESSNDDFSFNIPEIQNLISSKENSVNVEQTSKLEISFTGEQQLAFAFSCFVLEIDEEGNVSYQGEPDRMELTKASIAESSKEIPLKIFNDEFGMIDLDDE